MPCRGTIYEKTQLIGKASNEVCRILTRVLLNYFVLEHLKTKILRQISYVAFLSVSCKVTSSVDCLFTQIAKFMFKLCYMNTNYISLIQKHILVTRLTTKYFLKDCLKAYSAHIKTGKGLFWVRQHWKFIWIIKKYIFIVIYHEYSYMLWIWYILYS